MTEELNPCPTGQTVWIRRDHLQKAQQAPFLCTVEPTQRMADHVPLYTRAESAEVERLRADLLDCATMIRRMQRVIRKYNKNDKLVATASEFLRRKRLAGSLLRETDLAQPPEES